MITMNVISSGLSAVTRHIRTNRIRGFASTAASVHASQRASLADNLIQVDESDVVLGPISKYDGHISDSIIKGVTHRAFSVFMFSSVDWSLLIQKRAPTKIVFPQQWANTCCSHPLFTPDEMDTTRNIGIKRAASKRVLAELGLASIPPESFSFKDKIVYRQLSPGGVFGESEVDYILFQVSSDQSKTPFDPNEVEEVQRILPGPEGDRTRNLRDFIRTESAKGFPATPWFNLMVNEPECLEKWWSNMMSDSSSFLTTEFDPSTNKIRSFLH